MEGTTRGNDVAMVPPGAAVPHSPWHSPVPYLFGGLAAMLGLIAFALLILACSYWKLSGYLESSRRSESDDGDIESGGIKGSSGDGDGKPRQFEEKILVIMAGEVKPTFLATPKSSTSRSSSFGDGNNSNSDTGRTETETETENEKLEMGSNRAAGDRVGEH